jgi:hypothetical protein
MMMRSSYLVLLFIFLLTGCSLEQKFAKSFISAGRPSEYLLLPPTVILKYNLKEFEVPGIDTLDGYRKDSTLLANSLFLKSINDSLFIAQFTDGFVKNLESYGARVMLENSIDTLMEKEADAWVVNIAQFTLEEYIHPYSSEEEVYDEVLVIDGIDLNAINYNLWMELSHMNSEKKNKILFASDFLLDNINGTLKQNLLSGKYKFDYTIDTITSTQVYDFADRFGRKIASYLFDYLMNEYIGEKLPENYPYERYYYHYDMRGKSFYPVGEEDRFIELEGY